MASHYQSPLFTVDIIRGTSAPLHVLIQEPRFLLPVALCPWGRSFLCRMLPALPQIEVGEKAHCSYPGGLERPVSLRLPLLQQEQGTWSHLEVGAGVSHPPVPREERALHLESALWTLEDSLNTGYGPLNATAFQQRCLL